MINFIYTSLIVLILFCVGRTIIAKENLGNQKPVFKISRIDKAFELTGKLDNPIWSKAEAVELNFEIRPGDNIPAPEKTFVKALYDDKYIYFGFECFDSKPNEIRANITDRDRIFEDDYVIIAIDTYGDYQRAYEFAVNPFGIKGDLLAASDNEDSSIDLIWHSAASKNDRGWTAEIAIPFSSLNFPNTEGEQTWAVNIVRTIPRSSRTQISWARIDRNIPGFMNQAGWLKGLQNIKPGGAIELLPYVIGQQMGSIADFSNPGSKFNYDKVQGRIGGGIKYSPSPNFTLDAVINPDFSQIESDADQISVNTTFALQYEEKRPFFLLGRELLQTPMYYSRSINDPLAAARINGKAGSLSYMYMGAYDRNTVFVIPGEERSNTVATAIKSFANIGRLRYDFGNEDYAGAYLFSRNFDGGHNYLVGFDWNYKFWGNWYFNGEGFLTTTKELNDTKILNSQRKFGSTNYNAAFNGEEYSGEGIHLVLSHSQKAYNFNVVINNFSPTYQTYNGAFSSTGYRQFFTSHEYILYPENSFIERAEFGFSSNLQFNYDGIKKEQTVQPQFSLTLKGQTSIFASYLLVNDELFYGKQFNGINRGTVQINSRPLREISLFVYASMGKFIYRSNSPQMGFGHELSAEVTIKPSTQLNISLSYTRASLSNEQTDELYYDGNIYRAVGNYQFSPEFMFRTIFQYNTFSKSFQVYPLFSYKLNAFTTFYAGATSDYTNYENEFGVINTNQQYFIKLQYLLGL